ncbi:AAA family ATPase [Listeria goaensis]|uniref:AAA family ATPase n=1 Tax=Listeria goaensis TaxID=1649188 RepID=UPI000B591665|nr:AAA family ATPase [Listeria goaensis]
MHNGIGIYFGTFAPCHIGHYELVIRAKRECEEGVVVVVSGYDGDRGGSSGMGLTDRFRAMRELFKDDEMVQVIKLDEKDIPAYISADVNGWEEWWALLQTILAKELLTNSPRNYYVGEPEYQQELQKRVAREDVITFLERKETGLSGTLCRENPVKYWDYIMKPFRKFYVKKVLIYGTASTGKTTLTRDLARHYATSFSLEYAREYEETYNVRDDELSFRDLLNIGIGQFENNKKHIHSPANNGVFIADTDTMTTLNYIQYYCTEEEVENARVVFKHYIEKQEWDLIITLPPATRYVDDGFRDMSYSDDATRERMHQNFLNTLTEYNLSDKVAVLEGSFYEQYQAAIKLIDNLIKPEGEFA